MNNMETQAVTVQYWLKWPEEKPPYIGEYWVLNEIGQNTVYAWTGEKWMDLLLGQSAVYRPIAFSPIETFCFGWDQRTGRKLLQYAYQEPTQAPE